MLFADLLSNPVFSTNILLFTFKSLDNQVSPYLSDIIQFYVPSLELRSSADTRLLRLPPAHFNSSGRRAIFCKVPLLWDSLPYSLRPFFFYSIS